MVEKQRGGRGKRENGASALRYRMSMTCLDFEEEGEEGEEEER